MATWGASTMGKGTTVLSAKNPGAIGTAFEESTNENGYCLANVAYGTGMNLVNTEEKWHCGPTHTNGHRMD